MADCLAPGPLSAPISTEHSHILNGPFELCYQHLIIPEQQRQPPQPLGIKDEMIKKSAMAPIWQVGESARRCARQPSQAAGPARPSGREASTPLFLSSIRPPHSPEPSVCQDKQTRRHMLERLLENYWKSFSICARWKEARKPLLTVTESFRIAGVRSIAFKMRSEISKIHPHTWLIRSKLHYQTGSVIPGLLNSGRRTYAHTHWSVSLREKQTNEKLNITVRSIATNRWQLN